MDPPSITVHPADQLNALPNDNVVFTVTATGNMISYQWQKNDAVIMDGADYSGTQTNSLTVLSVTNPDDEGSFNVRVSSDALPDTLYSDTAELVISKSTLHPISSHLVNCILKLYDTDDLRLMFPNIGKADNSRP